MMLVVIAKRSKMSFIDFNKHPTVDDYVSANIKFTLNQYGVDDNSVELAEEYNLQAETDVNQERKNHE